MSVIMWVHSGEILPTGGDNVVKAEIDRIQSRKCGEKTSIGKRIAGQRNSMGTCT